MSTESLIRLGCRKELRIRKANHSEMRRRLVLCTPNRVCEEISVNNQIFYDNELAEGLFKSFPPCFIYNASSITKNKLKALGNTEFSYQK